MPVFQKLNFLYNIITCNSDPHARTVMSGLWTNLSFEPILFGELVEQVEPVHQIKLNHLKQLRSTFKELRYTSYPIKTQFQSWLTVTPTWNEPKQWCIWSCDAGFANSCSAPVPPTVTELKKPFQLGLRRRQTRWYEHAWTKHLNEGTKPWFLIFI